MGIQILKPDINSSFKDFTVEGNKIRFGLGSVKNVGINAVENIVKEREENGPYKDFTDFCERIYDEQVNRKCVESLIKAGAFDSLGKNRKTLLYSFDQILDTVQDEHSRAFSNQITMFDVANDEKDIEEMKYNFSEQTEFPEKELLSMEKEMLGMYISGHPLEKYREKIEKISNLNSIMIQEANDDISQGKDPDLKDGANVTIVGVITNIKKKFTKSNKLMAFITIEDLYGSCEIMTFENAYLKAQNILLEENIIAVNGRISIREDQDVAIIANSFKEINDIKIQENPNSFVGKTLVIDIRDFNEARKAKLRGAIRFFISDRNNLKVAVKQSDDKISSCGAIFANSDTIQAFKNIAGEDKVTIQ